MNRKHLLTYFLAFSLCTSVFSLAGATGTPIEPDVPQWNPEPEDQIVEYGEYLNYRIEAVDDEKVIWWWVNDTEHFFIEQEHRDWTILHTFYFLDPADYPVHVLVYDIDYNTNGAVFTIHVVDSFAPIIEQPTDVSYVEGTGNQNITWTIHDTNLDSYEIWLDGVLIDQAEFTMESTRYALVNQTVDILTEVSGVLVGNHQYELVVIDTGGNMARSVVDLDVLHAEKDTVDTGTTTTVTTSTTTTTTMTTETTTEESTPQNLILYIALFAAFLLVGTAVYVVERFV
jgi:hypothetical protein